MSSPRTPASSTSVATVLAAVLAAAVGCDSKPASSAPQGGTASPAKTGDASKPGDGKVAAGHDNPGGEKVKVVQGGGDDRYALSYDTPEATAGQESSVTVRVVPKQPWHMNLDFPTSLKLQPAEGVSLAAATLKKADAKLDESACSFDVKFTAAKPGEQTISGEFKFAVCQDEACSPVTETVEFKVAVK